MGGCPTYFAMHVQELLLIQCLNSMQFIFTSPNSSGGVGFADEETETQRLSDSLVTTTYKRQACVSDSCHLHHQLLPPSHLSLPLSRPLRYHPHSGALGCCFSSSVPWISPL